MVIFFFQAEDGIRDIGVTGVQTCALPISRNIRAARASEIENTVYVSCCLRASKIACHQTAKILCERSEERRVGKESGCRRSRYGWRGNTGRIFHRLEQLWRNLHFAVKHRQ